MAKKQEAAKELEAKKAELQDTDLNSVKEKENIESEADSTFIDEIKSTTWSTPEGDFDWEKDDKGFGNYDDAERQKLEELYSGTFNSINQGEIVEGTVVSINNKDVVLNVGYKSDGFVSFTEFRDLPDLKVGDKVDVFVETQEDENGQLILSRKRAKTQRSWEAINEALEQDLIIKGFVKSRTK